MQTVKILSCFPHQVYGAISSVNNSVLKWTHQKKKKSEKKRRRVEGLRMSFQNVKQYIQIVVFVTTMVHHDHGQQQQKVKVQPISFIFRYLQNKSWIQIWLYEWVNMQIEKMLFISLCGIKLLYRVLSFHHDGIPLMFLVGQVSEGPMSLFLSIWKHLHKSQFLLHFWKIILTVIEFLIWMYLSLSYLKFSDSCMYRLMVFFLNQIWKRFSLYFLT